jgi:hypothetical protein
MAGRQPANHGFLLVVTGYIQFFYDKDDACHNSYFFFGGYLKQKLRQDLNSLVVTLNGVIQDAIQIAGRSFSGNYNIDYNIKYLDTDRLFEGHRFCEPNKDYRDSWFFVMAGADALADGTVVEPSADCGWTCQLTGRLARQPVQTSGRT